MTFADKAINYFLSLPLPDNVPEGTQIINPYLNDEVKNIVKMFYNKFYSDNNERVFIIGINPGRFGGGLTGISFTDPAALKEQCGIDNNLGSKKELSSEFIYKVISEFGGVTKFFSKFFLTALYPLAIIKDGKNYNYYDEKELAAALSEEIKRSVICQSGFGAKKDIAISLGKRNSLYLENFNKELKIFKEIITLEHPRYIMQYKRKSLNQYINRFIAALKEVL